MSKLWFLFFVFVYSFPFGVNGYATPLIDAATQGNLIEVTRLLEQSEDVNQINTSGHSVLLMATSEGHTTIVEKLLSVPGIDVNYADRLNNTALHVAAINGYPAVAEKLLNVPGIDVNHADRMGMTTLMHAAKEGHTAIAEKLLSIPEIDVNHAEKLDWTTLMHAAKEGHTAVVEKLLSVPGVDVHQKNRADRTALDYAVLCGHTEIAEMLQDPTKAASIRAKHTAKRIIQAPKNQMAAKCIAEAISMHGHDIIVTIVKSFDRSTFHKNFITSSGFVYGILAHLKNVSDNPNLANCSRPQLNRTT